MRVCVAVVGLVGIVASGCVGKGIAEEEQGAGLAISASNVAGMGAIAPGQSLVSTTRAGRKYRAWSFEGTAGAVVDLRVSSKYGDPVAYVCADDLTILARNDDADDDGARYPTDSHVLVTLPATGTALVVVKDYNGERRRITVSLEVTASTPPDAAWIAAAEDEANRLLGPFAPIVPFQVDVATLPAAGQARAAASGEVLEVPTAYALTFQGRAFYVVLATDGSGEGNVVVVDLIDGPTGSWIGHGIGHTYWDDDAPLTWSLDDSDPVLCRCDSPEGSATCTWMDGSTSTSTEIDCSEM